jgi:hypothetical protein
MQNCICICVRFEVFTAVTMKTAVSEELNASIIGATRIDEVVNTLAVISNRPTLCASVASYC